MTLDKLQYNFNLLVMFFNTLENILGTAVVKRSRELATVREIRGSNLGNGCFELYLFSVALL